MGRYEWLDRIEKKLYIMPFVINLDNQYREILEEKFQFIFDDFRKAGAEKKILNHLKKVEDTLLEALDFYYKGQLSEAYIKIDNLVKNIKRIQPAIESIDNIYPLWGNGEKVKLFRARLSENMISYSADQMLHIPFDMRSKVKTERFSIPGLPCLYLGNTSYACWVEMGAPDSSKFNVSPILLEKEFMVLNLAVSIRHILFWNDSIEDNLSKEESDETMELWVTLLLMTIATSYSVNEENRNFKSEYILSQLIMLSCKSNNLEGIVYVSKKVSEEIFGHTVAVNLALFMDYNKESKYSEVCKYIKTADSHNFAFYNQILEYSQKYKTVDMTISNSPFFNNIGTYSRQISYKETTFYGFDQFLFSGELKKINLK